MIIEFKLIFKGFNVNLHQDVQIHAIQTVLDKY